MKTTTKKLTAILLCLLLFLTGIATLFAVRPQKAEAFANEEIDYTDSIYYFSDSKRVLSNEELDSVRGNSKIFYDFHRLTSAQEFKYLLYTGYFWRFTESENVTVIIQINTVTLDQQMWDDLALCLSEQKKCKPLFITTENNREYVRKPFICLESGFNYFLQKPFNLCLIENEMFKANSALFVEGSLAGIYGSDTVDLYSLLYRNAPLHRLLNHMFFGIDENQFESFDAGLYARLWEFYDDNFLEYYGYNYSFYEDIPNISDLISVWVRADETHEEYAEDPNNRGFWETHQEEYREFYIQTTANYYQEYNYFSNLPENVHLFANAEGNIYFDLLDFDGSGNAKKYTFDDYSQLFDFLDPDVSLLSDAYDPLPSVPERVPITVCGMAAWIITKEFYNLLYAAQKAAQNKPDGFNWNIDDVPVYMWEVSNVSWGTGGLEVDYDGEEELSDSEREELLNIIKAILDQTPSDNIEYYW